MRTYTHTYIHTYTHTYIHTYMHTYIHTYIHAYIHTYTHTYVRTYRPMNLLNMGAKVLEKLLINRINHQMYKHDILTDRQFGFTPQNNTTDAAMEAKYL